MKPITEQERQEIIEHARSMIDFYRSNLSIENVDDDAREQWEYDLSIAEIALASLTAEPFVYVNAVTVRNGVVASLVANGVGLYDGNLPVELYSTPTVPVIKFPEHRIVDVLQGGGAVMSIGYNQAIDEIKRLNGIK